MKKKKIIFLLILVTILSITATALFFSFYKVDYVQEFKMSIIVGTHLGIDTSSDELRFGMVPPGSTSTTRKINVLNNKDYPLKVNVKKYGALKSWITVSPSSFVINPNEDKQVNFNIRPPLNTDYGNYTGKVRFYFIKI